MTDYLYRRALITREAQGTITTGERVFPIVASTADLDSYDSIVEPSWILDRYLKNPVVLWDHNAHLTADTLPIGTVRNLRVENDALVGELVLASERANPRAEQVYQSIIEGTLRGVSVGFHPRDVRFEMIDDREVMVCSNNELREISITPVPANPNALIQLRRQAARTRKPMIKQTRADGDQPAPSMSNYEEFSAYVCAAPNDCEGMTDEMKSSVSQAIKARMDQCKAASEPEGEKPSEEMSRSILKTLGAKSVESAIVAIEALRERSAKADTLARDLDAERTKSLVDQARREGRLTPAMEARESWKRTIAKGSDAVKDALELLDPNPMTRAPETQPPVNSDTVQLTDEDREVCKRTGQDPEKFLAYKRDLHKRSAA